MTKKEFARIHGITPQWLSHLMKSEMPSDELAKKLSETTGKPMSVFFGPKPKMRAVIEKYCQQN